MRHNKHWLLLGMFMFLLSLIGCQKDRISQTDTTNLTAESTRATSNVLGVYKKKTKPQGRDFYEIIVSVERQYDLDQVGYRTILRVTSRVRRHVPFWFDHSKVAYHDLKVSYILDRGEEGQLTGSYSAKELEVSRLFSLQWIRSISVSGHAVKREKLVKIFDLDLRLGEAAD